MKKTNKGFSLVELIIVIAIMAILAGALAPALIKYINKSRGSAAISNAQQIASAVQTALSNEKVFDTASDVSTTDFANFKTSCKFGDELEKTIGKSVTHKAKKDFHPVSGATVSTLYYVSLKTADNEVKVYVGASDSNHMVYPTIGSSWVD